MFRSTYPPKVDPVEQHRQSGGVNLNVRDIIEPVRDPETPTLKPLVTRNEMQALRLQPRILCV